MRVTLLLADAVQAIDNKLYILGGGWSVTGPQPIPFGIAMKIEVPWDETNLKHQWELDLMTADGQAVLVRSTPEEEPHPLQIAGDFEVGRPPGMPPGTPIDLALAINMGPLPLAPGARFEWRLTIDGRTEEDWRLGFSTRARTD